MTRALNNTLGLTDTLCPSWFDLDRWRLGELDTARSVVLRRHLEGCARCQRRVRESMDAFETMPGGPAGFVEALVRRTRAAHQRRFVLPLVATAWVVAVLALLAWRPALLWPAKSPYRRKGASDVALTIYREHAGHVTRLADGALVAPGDRLRFETLAPLGAEVMIIGIEANGQHFVYYPLDGSEHSKPHLTEGTTLLDGATRLDDSVGPESIVLWVCPNPFDAATVRMEHVPACQTLSFRVRKAPP